MTTFKHEWTLDLPKLNAVAHYRGRNLCVQLQRSSDGNYRAVLVDLGEFRGDGSTEGLAIDDLINDLEHVAAEIRHASSLGELIALSTRNDHRSGLGLRSCGLTRCQHEVFDGAGLRIWCEHCDTPVRRRCFALLDSTNAKGVP